MTICVTASPARGKLEGGKWSYLIYNLLDTATVASHIIYKEVFPADKKSYKDRGFFNELLAKDLLLKHLMRRMGLTKRTKIVKLGYEILKLQWSLGNQTVTRAGEKRKAVKGRCSRCPRKKDRKVRQVCSKCGEFVCNNHCRINKICIISQQNTSESKPR